MSDASGGDGAAGDAAVHTVESQLSDDDKKALDEARAAVDHTRVALASADAGRAGAARKSERAQQDADAAVLAAEHAQGDFERAEANHQAALDHLASLPGGEA